MPGGRTVKRRAASIGPSALGNPAPGVAEPSVRRSPASTRPCACKPGAKQLFGSVHVANHDSQQMRPPQRRRVLWARRQPPMTANSWLPVPAQLRTRAGHVLKYRTGALGAGTAASIELLQGRLRLRPRPQSPCAPAHRARCVVEADLRRSGEARRALLRWPSSRGGQPCPVSKSTRPASPPQSQRCWSQSDVGLDGSPVSACQRRASRRLRRRRPPSRVRRELRTRDLTVRVHAASPRLREVRRDR